MTKLLILATASLQVGLYICGLHHSLCRVKYTLFIRHIRQRGYLTKSDVNVTLRRWQLFDLPDWKFPSRPENILDNEKWGNFHDFLSNVYAKKFGEKRCVNWKTKWRRVSGLHHTLLMWVILTWRLSELKQCNKQEIHFNSNDIERFLWQVVQCHCYSTWWTTVTISSLVVSVSDHAFILFFLAECYCF